MAEVEEAIFTRLTTHAGTTALVVLRVHFNKLPQDVTYPAIRISRVSAERFRSHSGGTNLLTMTNFQIDAWAETYSEAKALAKQIRLALDFFSGTVTTVVIQGVELTNDRDLYDDKAEVYAVSADYTIAHED